MSYPVNSIFIYLSLKDTFQKNAIFQLPAISVQKKLNNKNF